MIRRLRGTIYHQRLNPLKHQFRYPAWYTVADLRQEQPFKSTHHLDKNDQPILEKLEALAEERNLDMQGPVWMLAQPPTWGLGFNPLSVYYLHDAHHQPSAMVLEVRNTPWRERTLYWLTGQQEVQQAWEKTFHVSPFNPAGQSYRIQARWPAEDFQLHLDLDQNESPVLCAGFKLQSIESPTVKDYLGQKAMPLITLFGIYWQALKLWCKGLPYQPYPAELKK